MSNTRPMQDETRDMLILAEGTLVNQYRIVELISAGGMGEVYLAADTKLKRNVALKFPFSSRDPQFNLRFLREAEATAQLNHPNVVTIHEIGECSDRPFIVMEYVDGESLKSLCSRERPELDRTIDLMKGICSGLAVAHDKGIIHRDIKPANIVIDSRGCPKILDFGLASISGSDLLSKKGSITGTLRYMSPEQIRGETLDHRTDLFSLGIMLYELITGHSPFNDANEGAILHSILHDDPKPIATYRQDVSSHVEKVVKQLLERDRQRRFQSALEVQPALQTFAAPHRTFQNVSSASSKSILVLPFENLAAGQEDSYFSNGLTEEIITDLGKIGGIMVISRKSSMQLLGTTKDLTTLGQEFAVQYVMTGSVRRAGQNIRVNAELVDTTSNRQMWTERYSGSLEDVFEIQESIARSITDALKLKLTASENHALARRGIRHVKAHDLYLRARQENERWSREGLEQAHRFLEEALRYEPDSAVLHAALGYNYYNFVNLGFHQHDSIDRALACVQKAQELDPDSIDAVRLLGVIQMSLTGEAREGFRNLQRVLEKSPQDTEAMQWMVLSGCFQGKTDFALEWAQRLVRIEPFVHLNELFLAFAHFMHGQFEQASQIMATVFTHIPDNPLAQFALTLIHFYEKRFDEAEFHARAIESRPVPGILDRMILLLIYARKNQRDKFEAILNEDCKTSARRDMQYPWHIGVGSLLLGESEEALKWLRLAVDNGFGNYRFLEELDPFLTPLRSDPRFLELIYRARQEALAT